MMNISRRSRDLPPWLALRVKTEMKALNPVGGMVWLARILTGGFCCVVLGLFCPTFIHAGMPAWIKVLGCLAVLLAFVMMIMVAFNDPMVVFPQAGYKHVLGRVMQDLTAHERMSYEAHMRRE